MTESERETFREKLRISLLERLIFQVALSPTSLAGPEGGRLTLQWLKDWLDENGNLLSETYITRLDDQVAAVILSEEANAVIEKMKNVAASVDRGLPKS